MFTLEQLNEIHDRLGKQSTLAAYLRELRAIGVDESESFVTDGHTVHRGNGHTVETPPAHEVFEVAETSDREQLLDHLHRHEQGRTSYQEMSKGLADSGVASWIFDTHELTLTYYDKTGSPLLTETIA